MQHAKPALETASVLSYYAAHGAALFPIPAGAKSPVGIVGSFAADCSRDPATWERWAQANPECNWGIVAGPSRLIIVDVDAAKIGRDVAWAAWCEWCTSAGIPVAMPHVQSARGGWHIYFALPDDAPPLRQVALCPDIIDLRVGNGFTVAAGSYFQDGDARLPYVLLAPETPPHPAPAALIEHAKRAAPNRNVTKPGERDREDVAALVKWLTERDAFNDYESWVSIGMAIRLEYGDDGLDLWHLATWPDAIDTADAKWASFATDPDADSVTLNTFLDRAHKLGWRGQVRKSAASMFGEAGQVAALAAASGATLPAPVGGMPMLEGQAMLAQIAQPIVEDFLNGLAVDLNSPLRPTSTDYAQLPDSCSGHGLYLPLREAIDRIVAMAETPKTFKAVKVVDVLAVLSLVHPDTAASVARKIKSFGNTLPDSKIKQTAANLDDIVRRKFVTNDEWHLNIKTGEKEHDNSDNVIVFLGQIGIELRYNEWLDKAELRGGPEAGVRWSDWSYIDDTVVAKLRTRANRTGTRFRPSKEFFWETLLAFAHTNPFDPAREYIDSCAKRWDGKARLSTWLIRACNVDADLYHQAVGRNIIGGMVRRVRRPGCKHDTMAVFFGPQGTGKSTLAKILAGWDEWFTDTIMLGDASKELVLSLAGKSVVEIGEMGMRGAANPNHVKAMVSRQVDEGRTAYARAVTQRPRRNIFIGTTNDDEPLQDPTGNRRFLPVHVTEEIDFLWTRQHLAQLIGEAAVLEAAGDDFTLPKSIWGIAAEHQDAARSESDIETRFNDWFAPTDMSGPLTWITASDLVELIGLAGWRSGTSNNVRGAIMKSMGFKYENIKLGGKRAKIWVRGPYKRPIDIPQIGTRYAIGVDGNNRPRVELRRVEAAAGQVGLPPVPGR